MVRLSGMIARLLYDNHGRGDGNYARYCVLGESGEMVAWIRRRGWERPFASKCKDHDLWVRGQIVGHTPEDSNTRDRFGFVRCV